MILTLNDLLGRVQHSRTGLSFLMMSSALYPNPKLSIGLHHLHQLLLLSLPESSGVENMNFFSPVLATVLVWEMSGGSLTSATEMEEVSDSKYE